MRTTEKKLVGTKRMIVAMSIFSAILAVVGLYCLASKDLMNAGLMCTSTGCLLINIAASKAKKQNYEAELSEAK